MAKDFKIAKTQGLCHRCEAALEKHSPVFFLTRMV